MLYPPISEVVLVAEPQAGVGNTRKASRDATVRYGTPRFLAPDKLTCTCPA
jgi:hypothetical protein